MDTLQLMILSLFIVGFLGAALQTYGPWKELFRIKLDPFFSSVTVGLLGLLGATALMILLVRTARNREGFQNPAAGAEMTSRFQKSLQSLLAPEVCQVFGEVQASMLQNEIGAPPNTIPEAEAKQRVQDSLLEAIPQGVLSCSDITTYLGSDLNDDTLYGLLATVPETLYSEVYGAAEYSRKAADDALDRIKQSLDTTTTASSPSAFESFVNICTPEVAEARRKFLREQKLSEEQQRCLLPEEAPPAEKNAFLRQKLDALDTNYARFLAGKPRTTLREILDEYKRTKAELDNYKKRAESGQITQDIKT